MPTTRKGWSVIKRAKWTVEVGVTVARGAVPCSVSGAELRVRRTGGSAERHNNTNLTGVGTTSSTVTGGYRPLQENIGCYLVGRNGCHDAAAAATAVPGVPTGAVVVPAIAVRDAVSTVRRLRGVALDIR